MSGAPERAKDLPVETDAGIPVVDVNMFLQYEQAEKEGKQPSSDLEQKLNDECKRVAQGLHEYGVLIVKDPRVSSQDNDRYVLFAFFCVCLREKEQVRCSIVFRA